MSETPCAIVRMWSPKQQLTAIEADAAERYRDAGYSPSIWPETNADEFTAYEKAGLLWVAVMRGRPVGFAVVDVYGDLDHLEEIDVLRGYQGQGIGAALIDAVLRNARLRGRRAVTLRTFLTTPWSVGLYQKMGFRRWDPSPTPSWLNEILAEEQANGLHPEERLGMRIDL